MGSLRTPVGPLPSSIYWRRRTVVLLLVALLVVLASWAVRSGGGEEAPAASTEDGRDGPATAITPGPSADESLIDERPGGREERDDEGADGDDPGDRGTAGNAGGAEDADDSGKGADDSDDKSGTGVDVAGLSDCGPADVIVSFRSAENAYAPGDRPELRLTVRNSSGVACKTDVGHGALTVTLSDSDDEQVWTSADCPKGPASHLVGVPANGTLVHTVTWDRRHSTSDCAGPAGRAASAGTYLAEAELAAFPVAQTSFRLEKS